MTFSNPTPPVPTIPVTPELETPLSFGTVLPLLLLPVRLETRFLGAGDGATDLAVRVYPDAIHVDTHEPELTAEELTWGKHFWERTWQADGDEAASRAAWQQLVERFDRSRAAWIARALTPKNLDASPAGTIDFPQPATKAESWTRAPLARLLPQRWWVLGYADQQLVVTAAGSPIAADLAVGPDPATLDDDGAEDAMRWMTDFTVAEQVGMGIRVRLTADQAARGFDFVLVLGTRATVEGPDQAQELAALLAAHHYTNGLGFTAQGTPSNRTEDALAADATVDRDGAVSFAEERLATGAAAAGSNAEVVRRALGLAGGATVLPNVANAGGREQVDARHMNRALWPATLGYFLSQMIGAPVADGDVAWARAHFVEHVRAAGPLPALRIGRQPYGVLPATSLRLWQSRAGEVDRPREDRLRTLVLQLWDVWARQLAQVARVGRSGQPDRDFADVFAADGLASSYSMRHLLGETYLQQLWRYLVPADLHNLDTWWQQRAVLTGATPAAFGVAPTSRLAAATYSGLHRSLSGPLVQPEIPTEDAPLAPNYLQLLLSATDLDVLRTESFGGEAPHGILYALLRRALLLAYWTAAARLRPLAPDALARPSTPIELEIVEDGALTVWSLLAEPMAGSPDVTVWTHLRQLAAAPLDAAGAAAVGPLLELRESFQHLAGVSGARLSRLAAGTLDLCSHRLDAWATSLAARRLAELRAQQETGLAVGGYGWVVNLTPAPTPQTVTVPGETEAVYVPATNPGYTHTPSLAQASTAAVLRSGHLVHARTDAADLLAVDLSSQRVRLATWLLAGVREGQPLGALLGYRFERNLQELGLAQFIAVFRQLAPLVANKLPATAVGSDRPVESIAANNTVDGLVLRRKWRVAGALSTLLAELPEQPNPDQLATWSHTLEHELMALDDAVDAVSDALLAESVHQAVQGNPTRVAGTLDAIAAGEAPPPELDVVRTPRTGIALTHRFAVLLDGTLPPGAGWAAGGVRADAEPRLNAWVATLLPDPTTVRCVVECVDPAGAVLDRREVRLADLALSPLDVVYASTAGRASPSELELRLCAAAAPLFTAPPAGATLRTAANRGTDWAPGDVSYGELAEVVRALHDLITGARAVDGSDVDVPEANQPIGVDLDELAGRADRAAAALRRAATELAVWVTEAGADVDAGRQLVGGCSLFGVSEAMPVAGERDALLAQAQAVARQVASRLDRLDTLEGAATAAGDEAARRLQVDRLHAVFGDAFVVAPLFLAANAADLRRALERSTDVQDGDPLAVVTWCTRAARVREPVERFETALRYAEALATGERLDLRVAQLPVQDAADRWVGLALDADRPLSSSRFSLVVQSLPALDVSRPLAGLLIDEWVEVVPSASETTAMVFQFDQPGAAPPQSLLLAVPPVADAAWTVHSLQQVLLETLDLARLRAVDPALLGELGHYLPATYLAVNDAGETVSTDLATLA